MFVNAKTAVVKNLEPWSFSASKRARSISECNINSNNTDFDDDENCNYDEFQPIQTTSYAKNEIIEFDRKTNSTQLTKFDVESNCYDINQLNNPNYCDDCKNSLNAFENQEITVIKNNRVSDWPNIYKISIFSFIDALQFSFFANSFYPLIREVYFYFLLLNKLFVYYLKIFK